MLSGQVFIEPLQESELSLVRSWRNHEAIRSFMFDQEFIAEDSHFEWFKRTQSNALKTLLICKTLKGTPVGFLQFDKLSVGSDVYEWGFYVAPGSEAGTGQIMLRAGLDFAFNQMQALKVFGRVLDFNIASRKVHLKLGFKKEGVLIKHYFLNDQYHNVHCFGYHRKDDGC